MLIQLYLDAYQNPGFEMRHSVLLSHLSGPGVPRKHPSLENSILSHTSMDRFKVSRTFCDFDDFDWQFVKMSKPEFKRCQSVTCLSFLYLKSRNSRIWVEPVSRFVFDPRIRQTFNLFSLSLAYQDNFSSNFVFFDSRTHYSKSSFLYTSQFTPLADKLLSKREIPN